LRRAFVLLTALAVAGCAAALREGVHVRGGTVEFRLRRPEASAVAIAGDFNGWSPTSHLMSRDGGVWTRRIRLAPGEHTFMYVIDGRDWVTPPAAAERVPDGFGGWNARVVVP
jgi:1,4-alpha-glucan branching enzyme